MHKQIKKALSVATALSVVAASMAPLLTKDVKAASLTDVTVELENETVSTAGYMKISFTTQTALSSGAVIEVTYDSSFTGGSSLTDSDIIIEDAANQYTDIGSETGIADGYFKTTLSSAVATGHTLNIWIGNTDPNYSNSGANQLTTPASAGNYNVSVTADTDGTGTTYDTGAGLAYVADDNDVTVTAVVPPVIDMEIYEQESNTNTTTNSCDLGVLSLNKVNTCVYDIGAATNNSSGLTIKVWADNALDDGSSNTIDDVADGTVTAGSEEYGFQITDDGSSDQYDGGTYETTDHDVPYNNGTYTEPQVFATTSTTIDGINTVTDRLEVTHKASMATDTVVGSYDQVVTYTAYTN